MDELSVSCRVKSKREKQTPYINTFIWNLEKWYWGTYLQGRNRDADIEGTLVGTEMGRREGEPEEKRWQIYTTTRKIASGELGFFFFIIIFWKLLFNTGSPVWCSVMAWRDGMQVGGREVPEGGDGYMHSYLSVVRQKPTWHCKAILLQFKIKKRT